jgi:hypothetical protein
MVPRCGTYRREHGASFNSLETAMASATHTCFEIVHFAFLPHVAPQRQEEAMKALGVWAAAQPGFLSRQSYHDARQSRWTDVVEWRDLEQATAAMERSQREPALAGVMALIDSATVHAGHFERRI